MNVSNSGLNKKTNSKVILTYNHLGCWEDNKSPKKINSVYIKILKKSRLTKKNESRKYLSTNNCKKLLISFQY